MSDRGVDRVEHDAPDRTDGVQGPWSQCRVRAVAGSVVGDICGAREREERHRYRKGDARMEDQNRTVQGPQDV